MYSSYCKNRFWLTPSLYFKHIGSGSSTLIYREYAPEKWQCGWRGPFTERSDVHIVKRKWIDSFTDNITFQSHFFRRNLIFSSTFAIILLVSQFARYLKSNDDVKITLLMIFVINICRNLSALLKEKETRLPILFISK